MRIRLNARLAHILRDLRPALAPLVLAGAVIALGVLMTLIAPRLRLAAVLTQEAVRLRAAALAHPLYSLIAFIAAYAGAVAIMLPVALILTFASGFVLGPVLGGIGSIGGATAGAAIVYALAEQSRGAPSAALQRRFPRLHVLRQSVMRHPFRYTLSLRLMPLTPFTLVSLAAGLSRIGWAPFMLGTLLGVTPECVIYPLIGSELGPGVVRGSGFRPLDHPALLLGLCAMAVMTLAGPALARRLAEAKA